MDCDDGVDCNNGVDCDDDKINCKFLLCCIDLQKSVILQKYFEITISKDAVNSNTLPAVAAHLVLAAIKAVIY